MGPPDLKSAEPFSRRRVESSVLVFSHFRVKNLVVICVLVFSHVRVITTVVLLTMLLTVLLAP